MPASLLEATHVFTHKTAFGWLAVASQNSESSKCDTLLAVTFAHANPQAALRALPKAAFEDRDISYNSGSVKESKPALAVTSKASPLVRRLGKFLDGNPDDLLDIEIDQSWCTPFQQAVINAVRQIPLGQTRTYGEIAKVAGSPRAARAVGTVMAQNRTPLVVPCHRVVASGGMGGFSARGGLRTKLRLLETEAAAQATKRPSRKTANSNGTRKRSPK